jgi:hypothetical protein
MEAKVGQRIMAAKASAEGHKSKKCFAVEHLLSVEDGASRIRDLQQFSTMIMDSKQLIELAFAAFGCSVQKTEGGG